MTKQVKLWLRITVFLAAVVLILYYTFTPVKDYVRHESYSYGGTNSGYGPTGARPIDEGWTAFNFYAGMSIYAVCVLGTGFILSLPFKGAQKK